MGPLFSNFVCNILILLLKKLASVSEQEGGAVGGRLTSQTRSLNAHFL